MDAFYHVWEMGGETWSNLSKMLFVADRVVVWSPTYRMIKEANKNFGFPYTPEDFLKLVEHGFIVIAGREEWLEHSSHRERLHFEKGYDLHPWEDKFDGRLRDLIGSNRVRPVADIPNLSEFVQDQIAEKAGHYTAALQRLQLGRVPNGWKNKMKLLGRKNINDQVFSAISDAFRHKDAHEKLKSTFLVESSEAPCFFTDIAGIPDVGYVPVISSPRMPVEEVIQYLRNIKPSRSVDEDIETLAALKENGVKKYFQEFHGSDVDVAKTIKTDLESLMSWYKHQELDKIDFAKLGHNVAASACVGLAFASAAKQILEDRHLERRDIFSILGFGLVAAITKPNIGAEVVGATLDAFEIASDVPAISGSGVPPKISNFAPMLITYGGKSSSNYTLEEVDRLIARLEKLIRTQKEGVDN